MDVKRWKLVLYEWIKSTDMSDVTGSLDQVHLDDYFDKYRQQVSPDADPNIVNFLNVNFPDYEILMNETNTISLQDYVYIFSLFLFHSCALKGNERFLMCCQKLEERHQLYIMKFFKYMRDEKEKGVKITKEMIRRGIKETTSIVLSPPPFMPLGSPLKTPTKLERSPPAKEFTNFKLKELKHLKVQLENERFERSLLEVEVKQNQEKVDSLVKKCKDLSREVLSLRNHLKVENNDENIDPNNQLIEHIKAKMEKEITARDDKICDLKDDISDLTQCKESLLEKINMIEKERKELSLKLCDFDESVCALQAEMTLKDEKILYLEQSNEELVQILGEYRQKSDRDVSSDCLEFSCSTYHTGMSSNEGENLGVVIDLQLKDKESELTALKEQLDTTNSEKANLLKTIDELNARVTSLEHDIKEHEESKKTAIVNLMQKIDMLSDKLRSTMAFNDETQKREKELEERLEREKSFNDKINNNTAILTQKLKEAREKLNSANEIMASTQEKFVQISRENEELKAQQTLKMCDLSKRYEEKFDKLKGQMKKLYEDAVASQNAKYTALENLRSKDASEHREEIQQLQKTIKDLKLTNEMLVKENQFLFNQWKFLDNGKSESFELTKIGATSTPFDYFVSEPSKEDEEEFNNEFLSELKGEKEVEDIRVATELQMRNSKYPPHLRDSYAVSKIDASMNEEEIRNGGGDKTPLIAPTSSSYQRKKDKRPSMLPTPSRRPSMGSSSSLRDALNLNSQGGKTPSKIKQIIGRFSMGKDELKRQNKKVSRIVSAKKRKRILSQNADDEDSESPVVSRSTEKREKDRKEKRKSAQDLNRPRLNDKSSSNESSSSTIVLDENDDDWLEMDVEDEARTLNTNTSEHDKSLEHIKVVEDHQKHQQKMRRKSFYNQRNSLMKLKFVSTSPMLGRASSNDFDKFHSCLSLQSEESFNVKNPRIHKTYTKCFINSHIEQLERISDMFVPQKERQLLIKESSASKYNWRDASKPLPLLIIIFLTLAILALAFLKDRNN